MFMKRALKNLKVVLIITLTHLLISSSLFAQAPQKMSYQAVIRDATNHLVVNTLVGMQISIIQGSELGTAVYIETQTPTTNENGLVTIEIGTGTTGDDFSAIAWSNDKYYIKTETDPAGGTDYTITGTSQLLSVPYALHAKTVTSYSETDPSVPVGTAPGQIQYWNGSAWITVAPGTTGQVLTFISGVPTWGAPGMGMGTNDVYNPKTGKIWMDRNLGATQVATSSTDEASYGDLYQWGRSTDGHQIRTSETTSDLSITDTPGHANFILAPSSPYDWLSNQKTNLWQSVSGVNNPCPTGYRIPTDTELDAERASWSSNNAAGAFASPLKLPMAGLRSNFNGSLSSVGSFGCYWSSIVDGTYSRRLNFSSSDAYVFSTYRAFGGSVRCLKE